jgi:hypothetical protein
VSVYLSVAPFLYQIRQHAQPADAARQTDRDFAGAEDLEARIAAARARAEPTLAEAWADLFARISKLLDDAIAQKRGVFFGNV